MVVNNEKRILGRSSFSLLIENISGMLKDPNQEPRRIFRYFNTTTTKGKRNVVITCYILGFLGLHAIWAHSKRNKTSIGEDKDDTQDAFKASS